MNIATNFFSKTALFVLFLLLPLSTYANLCLERGLGVYTNFFILLFLILSIGTLSILLLKKIWWGLGFWGALSFIFSLQLVYFSKATIARGALYDLVKLSRDLTWLTSYTFIVFVILFILLCTRSIFLYRQHDSEKKIFSNKHLLGVLMLLLLNSFLFVILHALGMECSGWPATSGF